MTHLISLSTRETVPLEGGGTQTRVTKVIEGRTTHLLIHVLLLLAIALAPALQYVPKAVLYGVFLFMGVGSMAGNQLFDRAELLFIWKPSSYPKYSYVQNVGKKSMHLFTLWQIVCFGIICARVPALYSGMHGPFPPRKCHCHKSFLNHQNNRVLWRHGRWHDED